MRDSPLGRRLWRQKRQGEAGRPIVCIARGHSIVGGMRWIGLGRNFLALPAIRRSIATGKGSPSMKPKSRTSRVRPEDRHLRTSLFQMTPELQEALVKSQRIVIIASERRGSGLFEVRLE